MNTHPYASLPSPAPAGAPITEFRGDHRFLSNFWFVPSGVHFGNLSAGTVEHLFQALKTVDPDERMKLLTTKRPGDAKIIGRTVTLRPDWEQVKLGVMAQLQASKYNDPVLRDMLLATGDAELVEGNHWGDTFWGVDSATGAGQNWLGRILMVQRSVLRMVSL